MTFDEKAGVTDHLSRPAHENWDMWIESLGGLDAFDQFLPYSVPKLCRLYIEDRHFNSVPVIEWDAAAGYPRRPKSSRDAMVATGPFRDFLVANGVTCFSNSECTAVLKRCAERRVLQAFGEILPEQVWAVLECKAETPDRFNADNVYDYDVTHVFLRTEEAHTYEKKDPKRRLVRKVNLKDAILEGNAR